MLAQEVDEDEFDSRDLVAMELEAGQISIHDDGLIHGSPVSQTFASHPATHSILFEFPARDG